MVQVVFQQNDDDANDKSGMENCKLNKADKRNENAFYVLSILLLLSFIRSCALDDHADDDDESTNAITIIYQSILCYSSPKPLRCHFQNTQTMRYFCVVERNRFHLQHYCWCSPLQW